MTRCPRIALSLSALLWMSVGAGLAAAGTARASVLGEAIGQQVDIDNYQHYLEDLLFTHIGESRAFNDEHDVARSNIRGVLTSHGLTIALEPFTYASETYYNIVATQVGEDHPDDIVVIGAHFDSVPGGPGADDNGTGTAVVMELARVLSQHRSPTTIKFVLFDREEQGLVGSWAFVDAHAGENILFAFTFDMIGHDSGAYGMDLYGKPESASVVGGFGDAINTYGSGLTRDLNYGNFAFSDHWPFESSGIPACVVIEDCYVCNTNYHTPNDAVDIAPDYITYPMIEDLLRSAVGFLVDELGITVYGDATADGLVNVDDLVAVITGWGPCPDPPATCGADVNHDALVDVNDVVEVIVHWE